MPRGDHDSVFKRKKPPRRYRVAVFDEGATPGTGAGTGRTHKLRWASQPRSLACLELLHVHDPGTGRRKSLPCPARVQFLDPVDTAGSPREQRVRVIRKSLVDSVARQSALAKSDRLTDRIGHLKRHGQTRTLSGNTFGQYHASDLNGRRSFGRAEANSIVPECSWIPTATATSTRVICSLGQDVARTA